MWTYYYPLHPWVWQDPFTEFINNDNDDKYESEINITEIDFIAENMDLLDYELKMPDEVNITLNNIITNTNNKIEHLGNIN